tara:strand:+ start:17 stop:340 length:324 start_codon:yes stop_codon:yes gene_type:complete
MFDSPENISYNIIYVLELEDNKYYIGITSNFNQRLYAHINGGSSKWTRTYKYKKIVEVTIGTLNDENRITERYILKYGIDNVSGGKYVIKASKEKLRKRLQTIMELD